MKEKTLVAILAAVAAFLGGLFALRAYNRNRIMSTLNTNKNVQAFLMMIRRCEGTAGPEGYRMMFTGKLFYSYADHPNQKNTANGLSSTAAGAYQFIYATWKRLQLTLGLDDFSPASQDAAAVELIREKGALEDVEAGRLDAAFLKLNKTWASLPGSPYGQPTKTATAAAAYFTQAGGQIA